jgi:hypothetical protein
MHSAILLVQISLAVPIAVGSIYAILRLLAVLAFRLRRPAPDPTGPWPVVSVHECRSAASRRG